MKKLLVILSVAFVAFATPSIADFYDFDGLIVDIEYSAGTGDNEAMLVLTFGIDTYAFLYSWDGSATGLDMLQTVDAASTDMTITYGAGNTIDTISYDGNSGGGVVPTSWWTIFLSTDGTSWSFQLDAPPHPDDYDLTDGDFNGYGLQTTINGQGTKPVTPVVPEPGTAALLIIGGVVAWGRARKRLG